MELSSYFKDFLTDIRLQANDRESLKNAHKDLRERLTNDEKLSGLIVNTFLQGSYRRSTAVRPVEEKHTDVDVVVVTKIDESVSPDQAMEEFKPFLEEHYKDQWEKQGRSIGISIDSVDLDLVITSAPSEADQEALKSASVSDDEELEEAPDLRFVPAWVGMSDRRSYSFTKSMLERAQEQEEWKLSPLRIPDRDAAEWDDTHPLEQIKWTRNKNASCNTHYINVVKAIKWWHRINANVPKYPKGYPLEHLIGVCCPDGIDYIASGVTLTLENIVSSYALDYANETVPAFRDHGVPEHNVWHRITAENFVAFYAEVQLAAQIARRALDANSIRESALAWAELFGAFFPPPPEDRSSSSGNGPSSSGRNGGFTPPPGPATPGRGRYA
jgi:hypothetical protein